MTKTEAHELLDARRGGLDVLPQAIDTALFICGDLRGDALGFSEGVDKSLQQKSPRTWESQGYDVVAGTVATMEAKSGLERTMDLKRRMNEISQGRRKSDSGS